MRRIQIRPLTAAVNLLLNIVDLCLGAMEGACEGRENRISIADETNIMEGIKRLIKVQPIAKISFLFFLYKWSRTVAASPQRPIFRCKYVDFAL